MESTSANIRRTYVDVGKPNGTHAKESLSQVATVPKGVERLNMAGRTRRKSAFVPSSVRVLSESIRTILGARVRVRVRVKVIVLSFH